MELELRQMKEMRTDQLVLIVEDDGDLANRMKTLIYEFVSKEPLVVHTMEKAIVIVKEKRESLRLVILDLNLPETEEDYRMIKEFEKEKDTLIEKIDMINARSEGEDKRLALREARDDRSRKQQEIAALILHYGGIQLVEEWRRSGASFPILLLTAVGNDGDLAKVLQKEGSNAARIVKPATSEEILEGCLKLLQRN
jgi:DNA-binding response OmpR family regulator